MSTRAATARKALVASNLEMVKPEPSASRTGTNEGIQAVVQPSETIYSINVANVGQDTRKKSFKKRKGVPLESQKDRVSSVQVVKGGWDELPHNIGNLAHGTENISGDGVISSTHQRKKLRHAAVKIEEKLDLENTIDLVGGGVSKLETVNAKARRNGLGDAKMDVPVVPESFDGGPPGETKHIIKSERISAGEGLYIDGDKPKRKRAPRVKKTEVADIQKERGEIFETNEITEKKPRKVKANPYGLTPGVSPFPDFIMPSVEACKQVEEALSKIHGKVRAPTEIPAPSLEVTGCGEVPSVLDALIRTRLSASTTTQNAKYAFTGLVERYGIRNEGIGAGSVDWNKVRESDVLDIEKAIKKGGLAKTKSISIKKILEMVNDINFARRNAFIGERSGSDVSHIIGANKMTRGQKDMEIATTDHGVLSLDFMHGFTPDEAMSELVKYPGIGVKTASCVILFCLQRPSFAVDTHVWRFCKWLKWVPEGATRDQTFSHCEVRIPNEMKYSLHQLFIRHGKTCGRCRAITGEASEGWEDTVCPLEHLVERTGKRKGVLQKKVTKTKRKASEQWSSESELSDLSDLHDLDVYESEVEDGN